MNIVRRAWAHPYCERALRLSSLVVVIGIPVHLWFVGGMNEHPGVFLLFVLGLPLLALTVAVPAGWLRRDNLRKSWGWLFGRS